MNYNFKKLNEQIQRYIENVEVKHSGILEIPEDKKFWQLPLKHYIDLVNKKGYGKIIRALTNLEVWNKNDNPEISQKASNIANKLKVWWENENK